MSMFGPALDADGFAIPVTDEDGFIPDGLAFTWESQAQQYPAGGHPGIRYFKGVIDETSHVDCLLFRDSHGLLVGIANYYAQDFPPWERAGNLNVWVHPDHRRRGIARALVMNAKARWPVDLSSQRFTRAGKALAEALIKEES